MTDEEIRQSFKDHESTFDKGGLSARYEAAEEWTRKYGQGRYYAFVEEYCVNSTVTILRKAVFDVGQNYRGWYDKSPHKCIKRENEYIQFIIDGTVTPLLRIEKGRYAEYVEINGKTLWSYMEVKKNE